MKMKINTKLFKSAGFWLGLAGEVILLLQAFGVDFGAAEAEAAVGSVCALLVTAGILTAPTDVEGDTDTDAGDGKTDK